MYIIAFKVALTVNAILGCFVHVCKPFNNSLNSIETPLLVQKTVKCEISYALAFRNRNIGYIDLL